MPAQIYRVIEYQQTSKHNLVDFYNNGERLFALYIQRLFQE